MLNDHDVSDDLRVRKKKSVSKPEKRLSDKIDEIACNSSLSGGEYIQLVESLKTPTENIDKMFEEVAAALFDSPVNSDLLCCQKSEDEVDNVITSKSTHEKVEHKNSPENIPTAGENMTACAPEVEKSMLKALSPMIDNNEDAKISSGPSTIDDNNKHDSQIDYVNSNAIAEEENQSHKNNSTDSEVDPNHLSNGKSLICEIPSEMLCKRQVHLVHFTKPVETVSSIRNIGNILDDIQDVCNVGKSGKPQEKMVSQELSCGTRKISSESQPIDRYNSHQSSFDHPRSSKLLLNEITSEIPLRPPRTKRRDPTEVLIERSQLIHNKKEEFMNRKLYGNNPYLKRTSVHDFDEHLIRKSQRNAVNDTLEPVDKADTDGKYGTSDPRLRENQRNADNDNLEPVLKADTDSKCEESKTTQNAGETAQNENKKSCISHSVTPPTTNLNVFDLFSRNATDNKTANGKDGCIIS